MRKIIAIAEVVLFFLVAGFLMVLALSCTGGKNVSKSETSVEKTLRDSLEKLNHTVTSLSNYYEKRLDELSESSVVFEEMPCPPDTVTVDGWGFRDLGNVWTPKGNKVTVKSDGSIEASGAIKSARVSKQLYEQQISKQNQTIDSLKKELQVKTETVQVEQTVKEKEVKPFKIPWFWFGFAGGVLFWAFLGGKIKLVTNKIFNR